MGSRVYQVKALIRYIYLYVRYEFEDQYPTPPVSRKRRRRLSLPLDSSWQGKLERTIFGTKEPSLQAQSPLMRLPAELRIQIYQYVVGGEQSTRLQMAYDLENKCAQAEGCERGTGVMGLLCSCRAVYTEFVPFVYSTPTFYFCDVYTFFAFAGTIVPDRLAQIRHLKLTYPLLPGSGPLTYPLDYKPMRYIRARSQLPKPTRAEAEEEKKTWGWAVDQMLKRMPGLEGEVFEGYPRIQ